MFRPSLGAKSHSAKTGPFARNPNRGFPTTDFFQEECFNNLETLIWGKTYPAYDRSHVSSAHSWEKSFAGNSVTSTGCSLWTVVPADCESTTLRIATHTDFLVFGVHYIRIKANEILFSGFGQKQAMICLDHVTRKSLSVGKIFVDTELPSRRTVSQMTIY